LPSEVAEYVRWGESDECRTMIRGTRGGGRRCSEAVACRAREEREARKWFYGWYDLGGFIPAPIMAIYHPRYHPQFFLVTVHPLITYSNMLTFIPRTKIIMKEIIYDPLEYNKVYRNILGNVKLEITFDETEIKAILSYLNSTFNWVWLEQNAGYASKGPLSIEVNVVERMPILNVKKINRKYVEELANLFDKLESTARLIIIGTGASLSKEDEEEEGYGKLRMFKELRSIFREIDSKIAEVLGIDVDVDVLWDQAWEMMERRVKGAEREARPGAKPMTEEKPSEGRRRGRRRRGGGSAPITSFF